MSNIKHICFITPTYATRDNPVNPFVDNLICEIARQGIKCSVIAPHSLTKQICRGIKKPKRKWSKDVGGGNKVDIYVPRYVSFSTKKIGFLDTMRVSEYFFKKTVEKEYKRQSIDADAIYGHFFSPYGFTAAEIGEKEGIPSFVANGESSLSSIGRLKKEKIQNLMEKFSGIISVSSDNRRELMDTGLINDKKSIENICVIPNGIDSTKFYNINKENIRKELGISNDAFVVIFVGHFIERKGSLNLSEALDRFDNIQSIFIGKGPEEPKCKNIIFSGTVPNNELYKYLNASDVFVLPTLAEGCCNAIIEAMACGLPIVSSNYAFNNDIIDDSCSIKVDPKSIDEISAAIEKIYNSPELKDRLSIGALDKAKNLNITNRASRIIDFMEERTK